MRTTIDLDAKLLNAAMKLTGVRTKSEVVRIALQELVRSRTKKNLLDLAGQIQIHERLRSQGDEEAARVA